MAVHTQFLTRPEGRLGYDVRGAGPLVVSVPGVGDLRSSYRFLAPVLADAGFRVATVDLRGHGDSDTTFTDYGDAATGDDIVALIRELGGGPAVVIGNSLGAAAAVWAAAHEPDLVSAIVMLGPFVRDAPTTPLTRILMAVALRRPWGAAAWGAYYRSLNAGIRPTDLADHVARIRTALRRPGAWSAFLRTIQTSHAPVTPLLANVSAPVLVMMGERDPDFTDPRAEADFIAGALGGGPAEVVMVADAGHYPQAQRPDVTGPAVAAFLATVRGA
ncbi:alpha/beta fold hydrolase [Jiangella alkaliphila]|uniref:Lysophospholipase, alpha-beta hydrolase superfamily n=1 Tax=Jiangella alkaliphila TaxID=419479 RepID=A0A1H2HA57_9ACTN|nr:alpha/beta fold hydrolase [Jiangella alkaliphila]SDU28438.1 Lysophospholipase, alpha-beta hydrolase superfamily [Jiangella alkaliphila]